MLLFFILNSISAEKVQKEGLFEQTLEDRQRFDLWKIWQV